MTLHKSLFGLEPLTFDTLGSDKNALPPMIFADPAREVSDTENKIEGKTQAGFFDSLTSTVRNSVQDTFKDGSGAFGDFSKGLVDRLLEKGGFSVRNSGETSENSQATGGVNNPQIQNTPDRNPSPAVQKFFTDLKDKFSVFRDNQPKGGFNIGFEGQQEPFKNFVRSPSGRAVSSFAAIAIGIGLVLLLRKK